MGLVFPHVCKEDGSSISRPRGRREDLALTHQGSRGLSPCWKSRSSFHELGDLGNVTGFSEPPFPSVQRTDATSAFAVWLRETELVTVSYEPQMCHVFGGTVLFLAITHSPGSLENLGLLEFGGRNGR